ncbi:ABC transporter substrate-binding protein [Vibrio profundum]|uniref:substrate-binding periplasmic protein n=1 Tax=Vibrio profundum TaxID=2910247 RepID=UPI003D124AE6
MMLKYIILLFLYLPVPVGAVELNNLRFITEEYPPYNYTDNGEIVGLSVDVLKLAAESIHDPINLIELQPWARGYMNLSNGPMVVLFSTTKTKEREAKFKWAGPITSTKIVALAKKDKKIKISKPEEFEKYVIGVVRSDVGEQLLLSLGVNDGRLRQSHSPKLMVKKLNYDRVDIIAYDINVAKSIMKKENIDFYNYEVVYTLSQSKLYYAFSLDTPDEFIDKLQKGIDIIRSNGDLDEIILKY